MGQVFCPACGAENQEGNRFCTKCGRALEKEILCPECGAREEEGALFCGSCGAKLSGPKEDKKKDGPPRKAILFLALGLVLVLVLVFFFVYIFQGPGRENADSHRMSQKREAEPVRREASRPGQDQVEDQEDQEEPKTTIAEGSLFIPQPWEGNSRQVNDLIERALAAPADDFYVRVNGVEVYRTTHPLVFGRGALVPLYEILDELKPYYSDWYNSLSIYSCRTDSDTVEEYRGYDPSLKEGDTFRIDYAAESDFISGYFTLGERVVEDSDGEEGIVYRDLIAPPLLIEGRIFMDIRDIQKEIIDCKAKQVGDELRISPKNVEED